VQTPGFGELPAAATAHVYPVPQPARPHAPVASIAVAGSAYAERQTALPRLFEKSYSAFDALLALAAALSLACVIHFFSVQLWDLDRVQAHMERFLEPINDAIVDAMKTLSDPFFYLTGSVSRVLRDLVCAFGLTMGSPILLGLFVSRAGWVPWWYSPVYYFLTDFKWAFLIVGGVCCALTLIARCTHFALRWAWQQACKWYRSRSAKKRIDTILSRPFHNTFFPATTLSIDPTGRPLFWAVVEDFLFFGWRSFFVVMWLIIHFVWKIPKRTRDICKVIIYVLTYQDRDGSSWEKLLSIFRTVLAFLKGWATQGCANFMWRIKLFREFFHLMYLLVLLPTYTLLLYILRLMRVPDDSISDYLLDQARLPMRDVMKKAYQRVAEMTKFDMVQIVAENEDLKDANRQLAADHKKLEERECSVQAKELGKQVVRYRKSVVHLLRYINHDSRFPYREIKDPELLMKDIEDFAAEGRLHEWNDTADRGLRA
jgi:hypothetical protein